MCDVPNKKPRETECEPRIGVRYREIAPLLTLLYYVPSAMEVVVRSEHQLVQHLGLSWIGKAAEDLLRGSR